MALREDPEVPKTSHHASNEARTLREQPPPQALQRIVRELLLRLVLSMTQFAVTLRPSSPQQGFWGTHIEQ